MENRAKKWVVAVLFAVLFACVAAFSLGVVVFNNTRARAAEASPKHDYETISVEYSLIYASDTSSELIKDHLTVYGTAADVEGEVELERGEYTVYLGNAESGTTDNWELSTSVSNTFTVVAGDAKFTFSAVAVAVRVSSVVVTPSFEVRNGANYKDGSVLYLYTFDNVKANITVVGYNNDGRPYNGTVENSTLSADAYSVIGSSDPGAQSLSVQWVQDGSTFTSTQFTVVLTQDEVEELIVNEETLPESVSSSSTVSYALFTGTEITARYLSGRKEVIQQLSRVTFTGTLHDASAAEGETFRETITASYEGVRTTFQISVTQVAPASITLMNASGITYIEGQAYEQLDTTGIIVMVMYAGGTQKILQNLSSEEFDIEYSGGDESHSNDYFRVGDTQATVTFIDAGVSPAFPITYTLSISQTPIEAPTFDEQALTFNGNEQSKTLGAAYDAEIMKITDENGNSSSELMAFDQASGTVTVTNAGPYTFRVYLTDKNYTFSSTPSGAASKDEDENGEYIVYTFTVAKQSFENWSFTVNISDWIYQQYSADEHGPSVTGLPEEVSWNWDHYITYYFYGKSDDGSFNHGANDPQKLNEEELNALGVGGYYVYAVIAETVNYQGYRIPGTTIFSVTKQTLETPDSAKLNQIYNGTPQQANTEGLFGYGDIFTMSCDEQTNVPESGSYTATFTLTHPENHRWASTESASVTVNWTITQGQNKVQNLSVADANAWYYGDEAHEVTYNLLYTDGEVVSVIYWKGDEELGTTPPTDAGTYKVVVTVGETRNYKGDSAERSFTIKPKELDLPTVVYAGGEGGYIYSGSAIYVTVRAGYLDGDITVTGADSLSPYFTVGGTFTATDAKNSYSLQLTPTANYAWEGGSQDAQSILWNILPKELTAPTADGSTFTYDGTNQVYTFGNYQTGMTFTVTPDADEDKDGLLPDTAEGTVTAIHAGTYTIEVSLVSGNYAWADEYDLTFEFVIDRATTANPAITGYAEGENGYVYNYGAPIDVQLTANMSENGHYTIGGRTSAEDAGTYTITFTLNSNYKWATASEANGNNVEGVLSLDWHIVAKKITRPELTIPEGSRTYTGGNLNATLENFDEQVFVIDFAANNEKDNDGMSRNGATLTVLHAGEYTVTVSLNNKDAVNFVWATAGEESEVFKWSVAKATNSVTVDPISGWVYDGTKKNPVFSAERGTPTAAYEYSITKDGNRESGTNVKPINAGYYWMVVSVPEGDDWEGAESAEIQFLISRAKVDSPQAAAAEMYTSGDISLKLTDESDHTAGKYEIVSGNVGRDAGDYNARIQLHQNYKWAYDESEYDDNVRDMELSWSIAQRTLNRLALTTERSEVNDNNGSPQSQDNALKNYNETYAAEAYMFGALPEGLQRSGGTLSAVNAGEYSVTVSLSKNFVWATEGEETITLKWTIDKKGVTVPKVGIEDGRRLTFNGKEQYPTAIYNDAQNSPYYKSSERGLFWRHNGSGYELIESPVNYGTYYLYLDLKDPENYQWGIVEGDQNGTLDPLYQDSGVDSEDLSEAITLRVWFAISRATYGGSAEMNGWTYGDYTSANAPKPVIDTDIDLIDEAIQGGTLVPQIYYLGIDNNFGASENGGRGSLIAPQNAGTYRVLVIIGAYGDYDTVSIGGNNEVTFTIAPAELTVTVEGKGISYGDPLGEWVLSATGWVTAYGDAQYEADFLEAVKAAISCDYEQGSSNVGNYPITLNAPASLDDWAKNYSIVYESGKQVSVSQRKLTVVITGGQASYTYGDVISHGYDFENRYNNDPVTVTLTYTDTGNYNSTAAPKNVGTYTVTASISGNDNYVLDTQNTESVQFTIGQRKLTIVIAKDHTTIYGEDAPTWKIAEYTNIVAEDEEHLKDLVEKQGNFLSNYIKGKSGVNITYDVTLTEEALAAIRADAGNYNITVEKGSLTVTPRQITVKIADKTSIYGDEIVGLTADVDASDGKYGLVPGDADPWTLSAGDISKTSDAGEYTISGRCINDNYTINFKDGTYTITPRQVEIDFALSGDEGGFTVTYSGTQQKMTAEVSGTVNNDSISATITYDKTPLNAGGYTATATLAGENEKANNYYVTTGSGTAEDEYVYVRTAEQQFTIKKATLTVHAKESDGTVTYGNAAEFAYTLTGFVNGEESQQSKIVNGEIEYESDYIPGAANGSVRDDYYVKYRQGLSADNYDFVAAAENGTFKVVARKVTLNLDTLIAESFVYGEAAGARASITETLPESIAEDDLEFSYTYAGRDDTVYDEADTRAFPTFAGKYTVTVTIGNPNYELTGTNSKGYEITQKTVRVKADDKEITYGDRVPDYTISYTQADFVDGETAETAGIDKEALKLDCEYVQGDDATKYSITASGLTSRNYAFTYVNGTLTVKKKEITVTLSDGESTYLDSRDLYKQAYVTAGNLYTGGTGGTNTGDTAKEVYGFTVYRYDAQKYTQYDGDFSLGETPAGTYYFVLVNNMEGNYDITVVSEGEHLISIPEGEKPAGMHTIAPKKLNVTIEKDDRGFTFDGLQHAVRAKIDANQGVSDEYMISYYEGKLENGSDYKRTNVAPTEAGTYTVTFESENPNYSSASVTDSFTIAQRTVSIVWRNGDLPATNYWYNNQTQNIAAGYYAWEGGEMSGTWVPLKIEITSYSAYEGSDFGAPVGNVSVFKDAGQYTFAVSFAEDTYNYELPDDVTETFTILRAKIDVIIEDQSSEYGDEIVDLANRVVGEIYDDKGDVFTLTTDATSSSPVNSSGYTIWGSVVTGTDGARGQNYIVTFHKNEQSSQIPTAVYEIKARELLVSATYQVPDEDANTVVYGDEIDNEWFTLSYKRAGGMSGPLFVNEGDEAAISKPSDLSLLFRYDYSGGLSGTPADTPVSVTILTDSLKLANYHFTFEEGSVTIMVAQREISINKNFKAELPDVYKAEDLIDDVKLTTDYIEGKIGDEVIGDKAQGGHFNFSLSYFTQNDGAYEPVSAVVNAGTYYITITLTGGDSYTLKDPGYIEWKVDKAPLTIRLDGDTSTKDVIDNVIVRYGDNLPDSELQEYLVIEGLRGDDESNYKDDVVGNLTATHGYSVANINNPTPAGTQLPVKLAFEKELPNYVFDNEGDESHGTIEVAKRRINLTMNTYDDDGEVYGMYNGEQFEVSDEFWHVRAAEAKVSKAGGDNGLVGDDSLGKDVTFTYIYYGTSYDGVWSFTPEDGKTQNPKLAGMYTVRVTIVSENYIIYGGNADGVQSVDLTYRILKQRVEAPVFVGDGIDNGSALATGDAYTASVEFNANVISVVADSWKEANGGQIISTSMPANNIFTMTASAAGEYSVDLQLKDRFNYVWGADTGSEENTPSCTIKWFIVTYTDVSIEITGITVNEVQYGLKDGPFGSETVKWFDVDGWVYGISFAADDIGVQVTFDGGDGVYAGAIEYEFHRSVSGGWDSASSSFLGAGTYRVRAIVADPNYERKMSEWVYYTIDKQGIAVPTVANGVYNHGAAVTSELVGFDNALMSEGLACEHVTLVYSGGAWYLQANVVSSNHFIQIALTDPSNYCWLQDGETLSKTSVQIDWTIERYKVKAPTGYSENFSPEYNGSIITFKYTDSEDRAYYRVRGASGTNAGSYTFTVSLVNTNNYEWEGETTENLTENITVGWEIAQAANSWLDKEYSRAGWTYGGAPTVEKLPSAKFGDLVVTYYNEDDEPVEMFTSGTPAGTYTVVIYVKESANYTSPEEPIEAEFTVAQAPVTVIWSGAEGSVYNGEERALPTAAYNALLGEGSGIALNVTYSFENGFKNAGSYTFTAAFKADDAISANYEIVAGEQIVCVISAAEVQVEVLAQSAEYTGDTPKVSQEEGIAYRIISGKTYADFALTFSIPEDAHNAGTYAITAACAIDDNYSVTFTGSAVFTITPKNIGVSITAGGGTYGNVTQATAKADDDNAEVTLTYAGTPNGGEYTEYGTQVPTQAGSYVVTATVANGNYLVTGNNSAPFVIGKARVTVQPIESKMFTNQPLQADINVSEVEEGDIYTVVNDGGTDVGSYEVKFIFNEGKDNNFVWFYNDSEVNGTTLVLSFNITILTAERNPVTLSEPNGWTYGKDPETLVTTANFGTPVLVYAAAKDGVYGTDVPLHAGTYWVKAVVLATNNNERSESAAYEFTISALELETPEFADAETVYNGGAQTNAFTGYERSMMTISSNSGALVTTDGFALRASNVGEYFITFALSYTGGGREGDYIWKDAPEDDSVTITWTIKQAPNGWIGEYTRSGWTYGQAASEENIPDAEFGTVVVEYFTDSALQNEYRGSFGSDTDAGIYYVRVTVEGNSNYTGLTLGGDGTLSFEVEAAQNKWKDGQNAYKRESWTYGDAATAETLPVPQFGGASVAYYTDSAHTKPYTGSFDSRTNAGIYYVVITVDGGKNYSGITLNGQFEVEKRSLALPDLADTADTAVETGDTLHNEIVGFDSATMNMSELGSGITTINGKLYLAAKDAGVYQITISLADTSNYQWTDGKDGDVTLVWTLRRAELQSWTEESESRYPDVIVSAEGGIHPSYTLAISSIPESMYGEYDLSAYENAEIALGYDIGFTSGGEAVQPDTAITVRLKVTDEIASALGEGYTLLHLHGGEWSEVSYTIDNGYAVFTVTEFSDFLFITATPATSLVWLIVVLAVLLAVEIILLVVVIVKRRKGRN